MFTGLIEALGTVERIEPTAAGGRRLVVRAAAVASELPAGASIAVDGACLTAVEASDGRFAADVVATTCERTILGRYQAGAVVNLERAMRLGDRLGGHLVQGHVDAVGTLGDLRLDGDDRLATFTLPPEVEEATVPRGSIAVNGVSLTVASLSAGRCTVALVPHTWESTNLGRLRPGDPVNLEADLIGRHVARLAAVWRDARS